MRARIIADAKRRYLCAVFMGRADILRRAERVFRRLVVRA